MKSNIESLAIGVSVFAARLDVIGLAEAVSNIDAIAERPRPANSFVTQILKINIAATSR